MKSIFDKKKAEEMAEHETDKLKKEVDETNINELIFYCSFGKKLGIDLESALSDEGNSDNSQSTPDSEGSKTATSNTNASASKAEESTSKTSASKTTASASKAEESASKTSASKATTSASKENSSTAKTNANSSTSPKEENSSSSKENLSELRKNGMSEEQEESLKAYFHDKIQEKRRQCERDNAFNGKSIKDYILSVLTDINYEPLMNFIVNIDQIIRLFQKECPNICNVLEKVTDAIGASVDGLTIGALITSIFENPQVGLRLAAVYGAKRAVFALLNYIIENKVIEFIADQTKDPVLKENFIKSSKHIISIIDKTKTLVGAKDLKKNIKGVFGEALEHIPLSKEMKSKVIAGKMIIELNKPSMNAAAEAFNYQHIPDALVYNIDKGTISKVSYINPNAPKADHRNQAKFNEPDVHDAPYPIRKEIGSIEDMKGKILATEMNIALGKASMKSDQKSSMNAAVEEFMNRNIPDSHVYKMNKGTTDFQNPYNLFAKPPYVQQNNQNNGAQNQFNLFAKPPAQQNGQNNLNNAAPNTFMNFGNNFNKDFK